jgi:hypothetical protein
LLSEGSSLLDPVCGRKESAENIFFFKALNLVSDAANHDSDSTSIFFFSAGFSSFVATYGNCTGGFAASFCSVFSCGLAELT